MRKISGWRKRQRDEDDLLYYLYSILSFWLVILTRNE